MRVEWYGQSAFRLTGFLEPADAFLELVPAVHRLESSSFESDELRGGDRQLVIVPAAP